jgi:hypothetical protein
MKVGLTPHVKCTLYMETADESAGSGKVAEGGGAQPSGLLPIVLGWLHQGGEMAGMSLPCQGERARECSVAKS